MSSQPLQPAKHYAKLICHYMKTLPDKYADDPQDVQDALGLSNAEFKLGVDFCVAKKLITLDKPLSASPALAPTAAAVAKPPSVLAAAMAKPAASSSPFAMDDDEDEDETQGDRESVFGTAEVAAVG
jgi:hypothetical protein